MPTKLNLTWEMWRPIDLWTEAHSRHIKIPRFKEAQEGDPAPQSPHTDALLAGEEVKDEDFDLPDIILVNFFSLAPSFI